MEQDYVEKQVDAKIIEISQNHNIYDVGTVINVKDFIIEVAGMENVMFYEKINIANKAFGYVIAINESSINIAVLKINAPINVGDMVYSTNTLYKGSYSPSSVGRIIDLFGEDKLSSKKFSDLSDVPIERKTIPIMDRTAVCRPLLTGIAGIDLMYPIGKGQRQLIIGDKRTGKTQIGLDTIVNQKGKNVMCFYVAIGKTKKEVKTIYNELAKRGAISYTTIVTAFNDELPPVISLIPYFALSVAEDYMINGYDVLVVIDDLKRHAEAYREISLISGKTPGRDAYPADIFYTHSRLLEKGCQHKNGGSITILPIVETKGGDITDYISTNIISITDGQIVLSAKSFQKGEKPAIDYGLSVSRLGGAVQEKDMKVVGSIVRRKLLSYLETRHVYELVNMDEMSVELKNQFMEGRFILDNLNQYKFSAKTPSEMMTAFSDLVDGDTINIDNVSSSTSSDSSNVANVAVVNTDVAVNVSPEVVEKTPRQEVVLENIPSVETDNSPEVVENIPVQDVIENEVIDISVVSEIGQDNDNAQSSPVVDQVMAEQPIIENVVVESVPVSETSSVVSQPIIESVEPSEVASMEIFDDKEVAPEVGYDLNVESDSEVEITTPVEEYSLPDASIYDTASISTDEINDAMNTPVIEEYSLPKESIYDEEESATDEVVVPPVVNEEYSLPDEGIYDEDVVVENDNSGVEIPTVEEAQIDNAGVQLDIPVVEEEEEVL